MSKSAFEDWKTGGWKAFNRYAYQVSAYAYGFWNTVPEILLAIWEKDADDPEKGTLHYRHFSRPPIPRHELVKKVMKVESYVKKNELPPCDVTDYPCPFFYLHDEPDEPQITDPKLIEALRRYNELDTAIKGTTSQLADLRKQIIQMVGDKPTGQGGGFKYKLTHVVQWRLDTKLATEMLVKLGEEPVKVKSGYDKLTVTTVIE